MIAMALACKPKLLLADEPTTALDATVQKSIIELIQSLQKKYGLSIIFISHDLGIVSKISDKILVLNQGKRTDYGLSNDVFLHPKSPYTKGLIACRPQINTRPERLPVVVDFIQGKYDFQIKEDSERKKRHELIYSRPPVLTINNLNTYFHHKYNIFNRPVKSFMALCNINLSVWQGETLGLVGESGSGKSTLGRSLMRLIETVSGDMIYKGVNLSKLNKHELKQFRSKFQLVFQDPYSSLNPDHTLGYSIMEPMIVHKLYESNKVRKLKALELFEKTGLDTSFYNRYPHQLSGGQRQRVAIARALATCPEFLICDESVSALDVSIQAQILNLLNQLKNQMNLTYIFISHDLNVVKYMSDRILVLNQGQVEETGEADDLCKNPKKEYTRKLLNAAI
jgi:peptide/nickel transport system ATP-binding protein